MFLVLLLFYFNDIRLSFQSDYGLATSPLPRAIRDEIPLGLQCNIRRLQRTLSEDTKQRRRDSIPSTPTGYHPNFPMQLNHSK